MKQLSVRNPQKAAIIDPQTMFQYDNHKNIPWNVLQYDPIRQYFDPQQVILQRKYQTQKKGQKDTRHMTRRGFYMDPHIKIVKGLPASSHYNLGDPWNLSQNQKKMSMQRKVNSSLGKYTYLDRIAMEQKNRTKPAPNAYNLNKTDSQIKQELQKMKTKKLLYGPKRHFYEDIEHLSNTSPGMGNYNPHDNNIPHLRLNKTDYKFWGAKHEKMANSERKRRLSDTSPCHYNPVALQYDTFDRIRTASQLRKKKSTHKNGFGSDAKFPYDRPSKKQIIEKRPDPGDHNVFIPWKGKNQKSRNQGWLRSRSTGFSDNIYH